ncbi:MAG: Uma2 family endonuclease [Hydrococcus sp. SU_1_0]|nr:Uma2 family endonuclease [Hydrococcus sp. SU_1_0]
MIVTKDSFPRFTPEEYFQWEAEQQLRHEYINGQVYAMSGGTINHSKIASNLNFILKSHLRGGGCQVLNSDARVNIVESNDFVYPDVSVACDDRDRTAVQAIKYPCLVVEVLSPSTANYDRGDKFRMYRRNPILQDYLLVDAEKIALDLYRQNELGNWEIINYQAGDMIELKSISLSCLIEDIYEDIVFVKHSPTSQ